MVISGWSSFWLSAGEARRGRPVVSSQSINAPCFILAGLVLIIGLMRYVIRRRRATSEMNVAAAAAAAMSVCIDRPSVIVLVSQNYSDGTGRYF